MEAIDLRSDTVSWPTPAMREAMANALVGDDVYGEDPTVNLLEAEAAALLGKEAALFVTSGTQGNLVSIFTHCGRGDEMILGREAHTFRYEAGSASGMGSVHPHILDVQPDGTLRLDQIENAIRGQNIHYPRTKLICLENTQGTVGGMALSVEYTAQVGALARRYGVKLHIDGARLFNAAAALAPDDIPGTARALAADADSVTFCLSKGLCAPAGSLVVGTRAFIDEARRTRKMLGGGMRQAGILAAAGLISIREMIYRLPQDHANARRLAEGLADIPGVRIDAARVQTNMMFFDLTPDAPINADTLAERLKTEYNIYLRPLYGGTFRAVTHYWITRERVDCVLQAIRALLAQ
ncbi:MAG: low-specificity L-threonine aldolase [Chloroflexi bacterium]|nr:low-specificity L-threonine aldolase [Chloroflexota bacterium]